MIGIGQAHTLSLAPSRPLSTPFDPLNIPALSEWFDYRTLASVGEDNPVSAWAGRKGLYTATASATARPTYAADDGDARGVVIFDGVDDNASFAMTNGSLWGPDGNYEAWFVVKSPPSVASVNNLFVSAFGVQNTAFLTQPSYPRLTWYSTSLLNVGNVVEVQDSIWHVIRFSKSPLGQRLFVDGVNIGFSYSDPGGGSWATGDATAFIGGSDNFWQGGFRHALCFKAPLDDATAADLTTYLTMA